jgi:SAM-dependent methyltransferase
MRRLAALVVALVIAPQVEAAPAYTPKVGQAGKDVIWVPTPDALVDRMLAMAQVRPEDEVVDLGSGDGRLVVLAAKKYGARARGVEYDAGLVALSRQAARTAGVGKRVKFEQADIFKIDFAAATVVTLYLLPNINRRLRPILLRMRPGTRVVSHQFTMEDWLPDETSHVEQRAAHLWVVPAQVAGGWRLAMPDGTTVDLDLEQKFQRISGRVALASVRAGLRDAQLRGDAIRFTLVDMQGVTHEFAGRVLAGRMAGTVTSSGTPGTARPWSATPRPPAQE